MPLNEDNFYDDDDMMKYKKKARKTVNKSNHKHIYEDVLVTSINNGHQYLYLGKRCSICGKTKQETMFLSERDKETGFYRMLHNDEILKKYGNLPKVKEVSYGVFKDIPGEKYKKPTDNNTNNKNKEEDDDELL